MEMRFTPWITTRDGYLRLRFPGLRDWSGEVNVAPLNGNPGEPLVVSVWSDPGFGAPLDVRIEESHDGVHWTESNRPSVRVDREPAQAQRPRPTAPDSESQPRRED